MTEPITVRPAVPADAGAVADVHRDARAATMPYLPPQRRTREQVVAWAEALIGGPGTVLVAVRGTTVLGYAALDGDVLDHLYVRPDVLRRGVGSRLLAAVRRHAPGGLRLHVFEANVDARAFYARHGFTVVSRDCDNMERLPSLTLRSTPDSPQWTVGTAE